MTVKKQCHFYHNLSFDASKPFLVHGPSLVSCSTLAQNASHLYPISLQALADLACLLLELVKVELEVVKVKLEVMKVKLEMVEVELEVVKVELAVEWLVVVMVKGMARISHRG